MSNGKSNPAEPYDRTTDQRAPGVAAAVIWSVEKSFLTGTPLDPISPLELRRARRAVPTPRRRERMVDRIISIIPLLLALGCSTPGASLRAEPNVICPGEEVQLTWIATDSGTVSADRPTDGLGEVEAPGGQRKVHPNQTTKYTLTVRHYFKRNSSEASVDVRSQTPTSKRIGQSVADPSADCDDGSIWVTAVAPLDFWSPNLLVGQLATSDGRSYRVEHSGRSVEIAPNRPSDALKGLPVEGPWKLTTPFMSGEVCHHNVPRSLAVDVYGTCKAQGAR